MIRLANKHDVFHIKCSLIDFARKSNSPRAKDATKWQEATVDKTLNAILSGLGFILIDDDDRSILVAMKMPCMWTGEIQLHEIMLHSVHSITAVRLIKQYLEIGKQMIQDKQIVEVLLPAPSHTTDYSKFGMERVESYWRIK